MDDIHVLTYGDSTERNCSTLERIHERCEEWARKHGARFAPEKYELIHFAKRPKSFNMAATLNIGQIQKVATDNVRVLGVQVDTKLKWGPHLAKIEQKHTSQSLAIDRISTSTWGASFKMARLVCTSVVRPSIAYGASVWYVPQGAATSRKHVDRKLEVLQNKNLRRVLGAYRAVGSRILEKEAEIPSISTVLTAQVANVVKRRHTNKGAKVITKACATIRNQTVQSQKKRKPAKQTPGELVTSWLRKTLPRDTWNNDILQQATNGNPKSWREAVRDFTKKSWDKLWTAYLTAIPLGTVRAPAQLLTTGYTLVVHLGVSKATSSLITQIRTEKIGLNAFLADRHAPDKLAMCTCERSRQTAKHILYFCPEFADRREPI